MKLSQWARQQGIHYQTAWLWFKAGKIPGAYRSTSGSIFVPETDSSRGSRVVVYARVSNRERKDSLQGQLDRCTAFANARGLSVSQTYKEIGSGMNDSRRELWKMLDSDPSCVIVENKDRLTRFGFAYLEKLLAKRGCAILVLAVSEQNNEDLLKDLTSVIYSFCARLYGRRRAKNRLAAIKAAL